MLPDLNIGQTKVLMPKDWPLKTGALLTIVTPNGKHLKARVYGSDGEVVFIMPEKSKTRLQFKRWFEFYKKYLKIIKPIYQQRG